VGLTQRAFELSDKGLPLSVRSSSLTASTDSIQNRRQEVFCAIGYLLGIARFRTDHPWLRDNLGVRRGL
jgi:hypothetical protein